MLASHVSGGEPAMSGVRVDRLVILVAVVLGASGAAFGWSRSGLTDPAATALQLAASTEGDEVPNPAFAAPATTKTSSATPRPAASTEADEFPHPGSVAPAASETSAPTPQ